MNQSLVNYQNYLIMRILLLEVIMSSENLYILSTMKSILFEGRDTAELHLAA